MAIADSSTAVRLRERLIDLKRATTTRHALRRGTAEYDAAIEEEVRLANEVRRLADETTPPRPALALSPSRPLRGDPVAAGIPVRTIPR